jgi:hypothetical protein
MRLILKSGLILSAKLPHHFGALFYDRSRFLFLTSIHRAQFLKSLAQAAQPHQALRQRCCMRFTRQHCQCWSLGINAAAYSFIHRRPLHVISTTGTFTMRFLVDGS